MCVLIVFTDLPSIDLQINNSPTQCFFLSFSAYFSEQTVYLFLNNTSPVPALCLFSVLGVIIEINKNTVEVYKNSLYKILAVFCKGRN